MRKKSVAPSEYMSDAAVDFLPDACSGDVNGKVPIVVAELVWSWACEMPKSMRRARPGAAGHSGV